MRKNFPTKRPLTVRLLDPDSCEDWDGLCVYDEHRVLIRLRDTKNDGMMVETLLEEWSHALRTECPVRIKDEHDQIFWSILATITVDWRGE